MKFESAIKMQAFLDGELPEKEQADLRTLLAHDAEAQALFAELRQVRDALAGGELPRPVPASREFYWSQVERGMQRAELAGGRDPEVHPLWALWRRWMLPFAGVATIAAALVFALFQVPAGRLDDLETTLDDGSALTYRDHAAGVTLVWFTFPSDDDAEAERLEVFD